MERNDNIVDEEAYRTSNPATNDDVGLLQLYPDGSKQNAKSSSRMSQTKKSSENGSEKGYKKRIKNNLKNLEKGMKSDTPKWGEKDDPQFKSRGSFLSITDIFKNITGRRSSQQPAGRIDVGINQEIEPSNFSQGQKNNAQNRSLISEKQSENEQDSIKTDSKMADLHGDENVDFSLGCKQGEMSVRSFKKSVGRKDQNIQGNLESIENVDDTFCQKRKKLEIKLPPIVIPSPREPFVKPSTSKLISPPGIKSNINNLSPIPQVPTLLGPVQFQRRFTKKDQTKIQINSNEPQASPRQNIDQMKSQIQNLENYKKPEVDKNIITDEESKIQSQMQNIDNLIERQKEKKPNLKNRKEADKSNDRKKKKMAVNNLSQNSKSIDIDCFGSHTNSMDQKSENGSSENDQYDSESFSNKSDQSYGSVEVKKGKSNMSKANRRNKIDKWRSSQSSSRSLSRDYPEESYTDSSHYESSYGSQYLHSSHELSEVKYIKKQNQNNKHKDHKIRRSFNDLANSMNNSFKRQDSQSKRQDSDEEEKDKKVSDQLSVQNKKRIERMSFRKHRKGFLFYPEDSFKVHWDLLITLVLLTSCISTPYRIAFAENIDYMHWRIISYCIDFMFLLDIFVILNSAYYDQEFVIVESRKVIGLEYLNSWFAIDFLAIVPFEYVLQIGKLRQIDSSAKAFKLIKMTRLLRILKIVKERNKLIKYLNEILKVGLGFDRLVFFAIIFIILCHIGSCLWVMSAEFGQDMYATTWIISNADDMEGLGDWAYYWTSFYFTVSTITTVGYGDIHGTNMLERIMAIFIMIIGVMAFSFATGSLSSILSHYDQANAKLQERITVLNRIYKEYWLPLELYQRLRQAVKYDYNKDQDDINHFVAELPHKLKLEVSLYIHENIYKRIECFKGRSSAFIAWICPLLKPQPYTRDHYVYFEGDDIINIYFLVKGKCGFVLPKYNNTTYINISVGSHFGLIDVVGSVVQVKFDIENWINHKDILQRQFTVMAIRDSEVMCLSIQDLNRMKQEFHEAYEKLFNNSYTRLKKALMLKLRAMKICADREQEAYELSGIKTMASTADVNKENKIQDEFDEQQNNIEPDFQLDPIPLKQIDEESLESQSGSDENPKSSESSSQSMSDRSNTLSDQDSSEQSVTKLNQKLEKISECESVHSKSQKSRSLSDGRSRDQDQDSRKSNKTAKSRMTQSPIKKKNTLKESEFEDFALQNQPKDDYVVEQESKELLKRLSIMKQNKINTGANPMMSYRFSFSNGYGMGQVPPISIARSLSNTSLIASPTKIPGSPSKIPTSAAKVASPTKRHQSMKSLSPTKLNKPGLNIKKLKAEDRMEEQEVLIDPGINGMLPFIDFDRYFMEIMSKIDNMDSNHRLELKKINEKIDKMDKKLEGISNVGRLRGGGSPMSRKSLHNGGGAKSIRGLKQAREEKKAGGNIGSIGRFQIDLSRKKRQSVLVTGKNMFNFGGDFGLSVKKEESQGVVEETLSQTDDLSKFYSKMNKVAKKSGHERKKSSSNFDQKSQITSRPYLTKDLDQIQSLGSLDDSMTSSSGSPSSASSIVSNSSQKTPVLDKSAEETKSVMNSFMSRSQSRTPVKRKSSKKKKVVGTDTKSELSQLLSNHQRSVKRSTNSRESSKKKDSDTGFSSPSSPKRKLTKP